MVAVLAAGCGSTTTVTVTQTTTTVKTVTKTTATTIALPASAPPCSGADLQATFTAIPGSAGAGQTGYELVVTNTSNASCQVSGLPVATLLDKTGGALPTNIRAAQPGQGSVAAAIVRPGHAAKTDARFSPDVSGAGEQQTGQCEPTAYTLRLLAQGTGTVDAPIDPPTPVCEHGTLSFYGFVPAP